MYSKGHRVLHGDCSGVGLNFSFLHCVSDCIWDVATDRNMDCLVAWAISLKPIIALYWCKKKWACEAGGCSFHMVQLYGWLKKMGRSALCQPRHCSTAQQACRAFVQARAAKADSSDLQIKTFNSIAYGCKPFHSAHDAARKCRNTSTVAASWQQLLTSAPPWQVMKFDDKVKV